MKVETKRATVNNFGRVEDLGFDKKTYVARGNSMLDLRTLCPHLETGHRSARSSCQKKQVFLFLRSRNMRPENVISGKHQFLRSRSCRMHCIAQWKI